jgi:sugar lactone lactonase YvrE
MKKILFIFLLSPIVTEAQLITTILGNGTSSIFGGDSGPASLAQIYSPAGIIASGGNYVFSQNVGNTIRKVDSNNVINTIAGTSVSGSLGDNGPATSAQLHLPEGICLDSIGNVFIADHSNYKIRKINLITGIISTYAGTGTNGDSGDGASALLANFCPSDICFDKKGNLYISDAAHNKIRKVNTLGIISIYAGTGAQGFSGDDSLATNAKLWQPGGLTIDKYDNIYVVDGNNNRIRRIDTFGIITTIAGTGVGGYNGDNILAINANISPSFIAVDGIGNIYFSEITMRVRKINNVGIISTIAGTGVGGYNGDSILAINAQLNAPSGVAVDECGNLYISDTWNNRIRKVWFNTDTLPQVNIAVTPNDTVITGTQVTTTATSTNHGTVTSYQWVKNGANASTNSTYTYTPVNGDSVYCIVTVRACTGRIYTDTTTAIHLTVTGDAGVAGTTNYTTHTYPYPNPVTDVLHVATTEPQHYVLHNLMGITIQQGSVDKNNSIDMKAIPAGIYLLQLTNNEGQREVLRVVKE